MTLSEIRQAYDGTNEIELFREQSKYFRFGEFLTWLYGEQYGYFNNYIYDLVCIGFIFHTT